MQTPANQRKAYSDFEAAAVYARDAELRTDTEQRQFEGIGVDVPVRHSEDVQAAEARPPDAQAQLLLVL